MLTAIVVGAEGHICKHRRLGGCVGGGDCDDQGRVQGYKEFEEVHQQDQENLSQGKGEEKPVVIPVSDYGEGLGEWY